ncbi:ribosome assembly RNA-binding protein YhbY [Tolumonas osonensis]|uniref:RNA-binding protein n=1 Tax=Tolumonas osonensis TaxID=675874 RepID=A0A841G8M4_9GAMM|nr:ribosome assembly RNA-binding protein YhbY [Tolumonas osonensis]MBB6055474.1 RNA-binding protein [Tolumonas osonensis]
MNLTTKQKQYLKGLAHDLKPVVMLGQHGLTEGVLAEIDAALNHHELIKVKVSAADRETKKLIVDAIVRETNAVQVQVMGNVLTLFRPSEEKKISLPK